MQEKTGASEESKEASQMESTPAAGQGYRHKATMAEPDGHHTTDPTDLNILITTRFIAMEFSMAIVLMAKDTQKLMLYADKKFCLCSPFSKAYCTSALDC